MKDIKSWLVTFLVIPVLLLSSCAQVGNGTSVFTIEPTSQPTVTPSPIPSITPSPTLKFEGTILTAVANVRQTRAAPFNSLCIPPDYENIPIDIPEPGRFSWQDHKTSIGE